jgi:outer membrane protein
LFAIEVNSRKTYIMKKIKRNRTCSVRAVCAALLIMSIHASAHAVVTPVEGTTNQTQSQSASNLLELYQAAQNYDATFSGAKIALQANFEKTIQAKALLRPSVNALANGSFNYAEFIYVPVPDHRYESASVTLAANYPLWRPALGQVISQAEIGVKLSQAAFANAEQDLIVRVAQSYFDVLLAQDTLASIAAQKTAISEQLAQAKREFEVGTKTILDTNEAQSRYDAILAQEAVAKGDELAKREALSLLTGKTIATLPVLREAAPVVLPIPEDMSAWTQRAEEVGTAVQLAQLNAALAKSEVIRNKLNKHVTLDLTSNVSYARNIGSIASTARSNTFLASVGVQVGYPVYSAGSLDSKEREAAYNYAKALTDIDAAKRSAAQATRQTYLGLTYGVAQIKALESSVRSNKTLLDSTKLGYQVGVRIHLDVLNAQQALASTQTQLAKARYDALMAGLRLKALTLQLGANDVAALAALLQ